RPDALAGQHVLDRPGVVDGPVGDVAAELGDGGVLAHVGVVREAPDVLAGLVLLLHGLHHHGGIGVLGDHVGALGDQAHGGLTLLAGVEPGVHPHHVHLGLGIHAAHALGEGVDGHHHFGDGEGGHEAGDVALGHLAGDDAVQIAAFIEPAVVGG